MAQERKKLRLTKENDTEKGEMLDFFPTKEPKSQTFFSKVLLYSLKELAYVDLTGRFPF